MSKIYETVIPENKPYTRVKARKCDLCGLVAQGEDWEARGRYNVEETEVEEENMEIAELKQKKEALQGEIQRLVHEFQDDTGVVVKGVYVDMYPRWGASSVCLVEVEIYL